MDKNDIYEYLKDNLSLSFDKGEEGELLVELCLEDDIIDSKKFPSTILFNHLSNILYDYDY